MYRTVWKQVSILNQTLMDLQVFGCNKAIRDDCTHAIRIMSKIVSGSFPRLFVWWCCLLLNKKEMGSDPHAGV